MTTDPDEVETAVADLLGSVNDARDVAPDELVAAIDTSLEFVLALDAALAATDYDILTADLSVFDELGADMEAASAAIRAFNVEHCGFEYDETEVEPDSSTPATSDPDFDFGAGSFHDQFISQLVDDGFTLAEAACLFGEIDFTDPDTYTGEAAVTDLFVACGIDIDRIHELTVPEGGS